ncbi:MAG: hypothetical protein IKY98_02890 [Alphaproteobacteria bacterium]|nr:hypothetical protein [Alphaproteobacteria bacterium]
MIKILNYISNGRGAGLRWFLLYTMTICLLSVVLIGKIFTNILIKEPVLQEFIGRMPTLKIENGQLVEPADTFEVISIAKGLPYSVTINTTDNIPVHLNMDGGFYLTKETAYVKQDAVSDPIAMSFADVDDVVIDKAYLDNLVKRFATIWALFIGLGIFGLLWICFGLQIFILKMLFLIFSRSVSAAICARAGMLTWATLFTVNIFFISLGVVLNVTVLFIGSVAIAFALILKALKTPIAPKTSKMFFDGITPDRSVSDKVDFLTTDISAMAEDIKKQSKGEPQKTKRKTSNTSKKTPKKD